MKLTHSFAVITVKGCMLCNLKEELPGEWEEIVFYLNIIFCDCPQLEACYLISSPSTLEHDDLSSICHWETCYMSRTHLAEISNDVTSIGIGDGHDVEKERINVEIEGFVVEEEFRQ